MMLMIIIMMMMHDENDDDDDDDALYHNLSKFHYLRCRSVILYAVKSQATTHHNG